VLVDVNLKLVGSPFLSRKPASKEGSKLRGDGGSLLGGETNNKVVISFFVGQETKRVRDGLDAQN
jgi:hypothetical protein